MKRPPRRPSVDVGLVALHCPKRTQSSTRILMQYLAYWNMPTIALGLRLERVRTALSDAFRHSVSVISVLFIFLSVCLSSSVVVSAALSADQSLVTFSNKYYSPCGVSGNYSVVGFQGAFQAYPGSLPRVGLAGNISIFDDCYVAVTV